LSAYPKESVVSEKFEAMVSLGIANSRMKDFYDLYILSAEFDFDGDLLSRAIEATFARRQTALPDSTPTALTDAFAGDQIKSKQWAAFVKGGGLHVTVPALREIVARLHAFVWPPAEATRERRRFQLRWMRDQHTWV
jgi:hypothetical protein